MTIEEIDIGEELVKVHASLIVERDSQKGIVIGKGGADAAHDRDAGTRGDGTGPRDKVFLDLRVKVVKEWQRDPKALERLGF